MRLALALLALALAAVPAPWRFALAEGERAGAFDYYVLSLSWSPAYCALEGDARGDPQCDARQDRAFVLHGLWPQNEVGWPSFCRTAERDPSRAETAAMADITGSAGLAWYQWKKHGRCSGLSAHAYFETARRAYGKVHVPAVFTGLSRDARLPAKVVEEAFLEVNPGLTAGGITIDCKAGLIREVRICLTSALDFRACGPDASRDCRMPDALMPAVR